MTFFGLEENDGDNGDKYGGDGFSNTNGFFADRLSCYRFVPFPLPCVGTSTKVVPALLVLFFKEDDALERPPVELRPPVVPFATRR